jgi:hypothetical protein
MTTIFSIESFFEDLFYSIDAFLVKNFADYGFVSFYDETSITFEINKVIDCFNLCFAHDFIPDIIIIMGDFIEDLFYSIDDFLVKNFGNYGFVSFYEERDETSIIF